LFLYVIVPVKVWMKGLGVSYSMEHGPLLRRSEGEVKPGLLSADVGAALRTLRFVSPSMLAVSMYLQGSQHV